MSRDKWDARAKTEREGESNEYIRGRYDGRSLGRDEYTTPATEPSADAVVIMEALVAKLYAVAEAHNDRSCDYDVCKEVRDAVSYVQQNSTPAAPVGGFVVVPSKFHVSPDAWEAITFATGGPSTGKDEPYYDCTLWIGEIEGDDGSKTYGLHVSCDECPEEGSITLAEFSSPAAQPSAKDGVRGEEARQSEADIEIVQQALSDWCITFAYDFADDDAVLEARKRIQEHGTLHYIANALEATGRIRRATAPLPSQVGAEPVAWQFFDDGWHICKSESHRANTAADGRWPMRPLYTTPPAAQGDKATTATGLVDGALRKARNIASEPGTITQHGSGFVQGMRRAVNIIEAAIGREVSSG